MKKTKLTTFISKYHLSGMINSVEWTFKKNTCNVNFISDDKSLMGVINADLVIGDNSFGIYSTSDLLKFLSPLSEDLKIDVQIIDEKPTNLLISDEMSKGRYVLSDPAIIPKSASLKQLPDFNVEIQLTREIMNHFTRLANAIPDGTNVGIKTMGDKIQFVIGYSNINTNRLSFDVDAKITTELKNMIFSTQHIKAIFDNNKDMELGLLKISGEGIMRFQFKSPDTISEYFLVSLEEDN